MRPYVYRFAPVILIGALALTGCSGGDGGDAKPATAKEAWLDGNKTDVELDQDVARLARQCMEGKGFNIHPADPTGGEQWVFNPDEIIVDTGPSLNAEEVAVNGYGLDPRKGAEGENEGAPDPGASQDPVEGGDPADGSSTAPESPTEGTDDGQRFYSELTEEQQDAYHVAMEGVNKEKFLSDYYEKLGGDKPDEGTLQLHAETDEPPLPNHELITLPDGATRQYPTQGCLAEVNGKVFPDGVAAYLPQQYLALDKFGRIVWEDLDAGAGTQSLATAWSTCMAGRGYDGLSTPEDAYAKANEYYFGPAGGEEASQSELPSDADLDKAKTQEVKLAVAHLACDQETGYTTGKAALRKGALDAFVAEHDKELYGWDEYVKKALATAQDLLKS